MLGLGWHSQWKNWVNGISEFQDKNYENKIGRRNMCSGYGLKTFHGSSLVGSGVSQHQHLLTGVGGLSETPGTKVECTLGNGASKLDNIKDKII